MLNRPSVVVPLSYLKSRYPAVPWTSALDIARDDLLTEVLDEMYFSALGNLFGSQSSDDLKLYVFTKVLVDKVWRYMPYGFRQTLQNIGYYTDMLYTELDCVEIGLNLAKEEIHSVYIGENTKTVLDNRLQVTSLENTVSTTFQKLISDSDWIQADLARVATALVKNVKLYYSPLKANLRQTLGITGGEQGFMSLCLELHKQNHEAQKNRLGTNLTVVDMDWTSTHFLYDSALNTLGTIFFT